MRPRVADESLHLFRRRRQADGVEKHPADELPISAEGRRPYVQLLKLCVNQLIYKIVGRRLGKVGTGAVQDHAYLRSSHASQASREDCGKAAGSRRDSSIG